MLTDEEQREITEAAERIRRRQEDEEAIRELREMKERNEKKFHATADEQSALLKAKGNAERIKVRQRIDTRQRAENDRIEMANRQERPHIGHKLITPGSIKDSIRRGVQKTPASLDRMTTSMFGGLVEKMTTPTPSKQANAQYRSELKQLSRATGRGRISREPMRQVGTEYPRESIRANPDFERELFYRERMAEYQRLAAQQAYESPEVRTMFGGGDVISYNPHLLGTRQLPRRNVQDVLSVLTGTRKKKAPGINASLNRLNRMLF